MDKKQKAIEKMAGIIYDEIMSVIDKSKVLLLAWNAIRMSNELATALVNAGYGDLKAFAERLYEVFDEFLLCDRPFIERKIDETLNEFSGGEK